MNKYHIQTIQNYLKQSPPQLTWEELVVKFPEADKGDLAYAFLSFRERNIWGAILGVSIVAGLVNAAIIAGIYAFQISTLPQVFIVFFAILLLIIFYSWQRLGVKQAEFLQKFTLQILGGEKTFDFKNTNQFSIIAPESVFDQIISLNFDQKPTIYGDFQWTTINEDKTTHTHYRHLVCQEIDKKYEPVTILPHNALSLSNLFTAEENLIIDQEDTHLESMEFNKKFQIITKGNPRAAYEFLNPRLMEQIIKEYDLYPFDGLEVKNNQLLLVYKKLKFTPWPQFFGPILSTKDLEIVHQQFRYKLEQISRLTDVVHRSEVDVT